MQLTDWLLVEVALLLIGLTHISFDKNRFWPPTNKSLAFQTASSVYFRPLPLNLALIKFNIFKETVQPILNGVKVFQLFSWLGHLIAVCLKGVFFRLGKNQPMG
jgi:hypothetical protein